VHVTFCSVGVLHHLSPLEANMSSVVKGILIAVAVLVGLLILLAVGGAVWWSRHGEGLMAAAREAESAGAAYGATVDNNGCVAAGMERAHAGDSARFETAFALGPFMKACLEKSRPVPGFCDDLPGRTEFIKSQEYFDRKCMELYPNDPYCRPVLSQVQAYCRPNEADTTG
jgi:hypothetical protein